MKSLAGLIFFALGSILTAPASAELIQHLDASVSRSVITNRAGVVTEWKDQSSYNNDAKSGVGSVTYPSSTTLANGKVGLDFGSTRNTLSLFTAAEQDSWLNQSVRTDGFCVVVAFKCNALVGKWNDMIGNSSVVSSGFQMRYSRDGTMQAALGGKTIQKNGKQKVAAGDTIVYSFNYDASNGSYDFWDSKNNGSQTGIKAAADFSEDRDVTLGGMNKSSRYMNGLVGEVRIYNTVLTSTQLKQVQSEMIYKRSILQEDCHVVTTQYPTDDLIVTPYRADDFKIVADGMTDVTTEVQTALDAIRVLGGGVLFLPAGKYRISGILSIPTGVALRGDWKKPEIGLPIEGTILQAYTGRGDPNGTPFIGLNESSGVKGIAVWYPEQLPDNIQPYPPAIQSFSGKNPSVENVTIINAYQGISTYRYSGSGTMARPFVRNIYGTPLRTGIEFDLISDVGRIETVHFSPKFWKDSGLPNAPIANEHASWIYNNGTGIILRRTDWSYCCYVTVEGYNIGVAARPSRYDNKYPNGQCYGFTLKDCQTGIYCERVLYNSIQFSQINIEQAQKGIHLSSSSTGPVMFHTCSIDAGQHAVLNEGTSKVLMQSCDFQQGKVQANNGYLVIVDSDFNDTRTPQHIEIGPSVKCVSILSNRFESTPRIVNYSPYTVCIDHSPTVHDPLPDYSYAKPETEFKPAKSTLFVVTRSPYSAARDGITDDTLVFQGALQDARAHGGGIVFVPGGDYRLDGNLTVPSGVELRGIYDLPHDTKGRGSVLNIYAGRYEADGSPFIEIESGAGIRGLTFHYPEQIYDADDVNLGMVPYPFMIRGLGSNVYVINIAATIPYQLLDLATYRCDNHYVDYIRSTAIRTGIHVGNGSANGQIHNCHLNPNSYSHARMYYDSIPTVSADIKSLVCRTASAYVLGNVSGQVLHENFLFGARYGVLLTHEDGFGPSGHCLGMGVDKAELPLRINDIGNHGIDFINTQLVTSQQEYMDGEHYIETGPSFTGQFRMFNTACWGKSKRSVVIRGGRLELELFHSFDNTAELAFEVLNDASLECVGGVVHKYVSEFLQIDITASADFIGNIINTHSDQMSTNTSNVTSICNLQMQ